MSVGEKFKLSLQRLNPWTPLFAFVALFQLLRGANFDAIYFSVIVLILLTDSWKAFPYNFPSKPKIGLFGASVFSSLFGLLLFLVPRKSPFEIALMIGAFLIVLGLVWYKDSGPVPELTRAMNRSKWLWITCGVLINLWELFSYVANDLTGDSEEFPTISVLMSPVMADPVGRVLFLTLWLMAGLTMLRIAVRRPR